MNKPDTPFSPVATAQHVLRLAPTGALATLGGDGAPFASLVVVATTSAGEPILLLSQLAVHTKNLSNDSRTSLLVVAPGGEGGDPLEGARLTLTGTVVADPDPALRRRFLARHEDASLYADFADFAFYRLALDGAHLVAGFGRIVDLTPADLLVDCTDATDLLDAETEAIAHMNEDHRDALELYATRLCGMTDGAWTATGCDPAGLDLRAGQDRARLDFPERVRTAGELRKTLATLADKARASDNM